MTYNDFYNLFKTDFKTNYKNKCNEIFKKCGSELGIYRYHKKHQNWGILDENDVWCCRNTINTHPKVALELYNFYLEKNKNTEFDLNKFWDFFEENFELYFTKNVDDTYYNKLSFLTNKSWSTGQITSVAFYYGHKLLFPGSIDFTFNLERGDPEDFMGIDGRVVFENDNITIQIKSGELIKKGSYYLIIGSVNDFKSNADYYSYVDINKNETNIWVFKKDLDKTIMGGNQILIESDLLLKKITMESNCSQILNEILTLSAKNDFIFDMSNDHTKNEVVINGKNVSIKISNFNDENLPQMLENCLKELNDLIK